MLINSLNFRYMYRWGSSLCEVVPLLLFPWRLMWYALRFSHVSRSGLYFQWGTSWKSEEHVVVSQDGSLSAVFRGTAASAVSHFNVCPLSWVTIFRLGSCFHLHIPQPRLSKPKIVCRVRHLTLKWEREREKMLFCVFYEWTEPKQKSLFPVRRCHGDHRPQMYTEGAAEGAHLPGGHHYCSSR